MMYNLSNSSIYSTVSTIYAASSQNLFWNHGFIDFRIHVRSLVSLPLFSYSIRKAKPEEAVYSPLPHFLLVRLQRVVIFVVVSLQSFFSMFVVVVVLSTSIHPPIFEFASCTSTFFFFLFLSLSLSLRFSIFLFHRFHTLAFNYRFLHEHQGFSRLFNICSHAIPKRDLYFSLKKINVDRQTYVRSCTRFKLITFFDIIN